MSRSVEFRHWKHACGLASSLKEKKSVYVLDSERSPSSLSSSQLPAVDDLIRDNSITILHYVASTEGQTVFTGTGSSSCSMPERVDDEMDEATSTLLQDLEPRGGLNLGRSAVDNLDCTTAPTRPTPDLYDDIVLSVVEALKLADDTNASEKQLLRYCKYNISLLYIYIDIVNIISYL